MIFYTNLWACIIISFILILHAASVFAKSIISKISVYTNLALHIALFGLLLYIGAEISELAVIFMGSLLVYVSLSFFFSKKKCEKMGEEDVI